MRPTVVGCTGGIGAGKSTVAALLGERGATVLDADAEGRRALEPGAAGHAATLERFGGGVLRGDGRLDRERLARLVFTDPAARADLEAIVHPLVERAFAAAIAAAAPGSVLVLDAPLLVETGGRARYGLDGLLVVDAPEELALERLVRRRQMREEAARARIAAQLRRAERLRAADYVILNVGSLAELAAMVDAAWGWIASLRHEEVARRR